MASTNKIIDDIPFRVNEPKTGSNKPNVNTVKIALPNNIFSPNPIGNIGINGTISNNVGILKKRFKTHFDFWVRTKEPNISNPAKAGIIKNAAPFRKKASSKLIRIHRNSGAT